MKALLWNLSVLATVTPLAAESVLEWRQQLPADCPFETSAEFAGVRFTGKHSDYQVGNTFYPSWAADGNLYSPWTDGETDGVKCSSGGAINSGFKTGHAVMVGDDPLRLDIRNTSPPKQALATPYRGRYPCGSLVHNGCAGTGRCWGRCRAFRFRATSARLGSRRRCRLPSLFFPSRPDSSGR